MNQLIACISWNENAKSPNVEKGSFDNGIVTLTAERIPVFTYGNKEICYNEKNNTVVAIIGYLTNLIQLCHKYQIEPAEDATVIEKIYNIEGTRFFGEVEGSFTIFIWDGKVSAGYVFQDEYGSGIPLYYTQNGSMLCIGSSLREILRREVVKRVINMAAARDFMIAKTMIPNQQTFIKGIYKLVPGRYLSFRTRNISVKCRRIFYSRRKLTLEYAKSQLMNALKKNVHALHGLLKNKQRICTLSAGYDSNAILHYLSELSDNIQAFTIGGQRRNEIPNASKLAAQYHQVKHYTALVGDDKLAFFPDIVWRTEGYICESGLFLQYELAGLLNKHGFTELMCGEAGDQILNQCREKPSLTMLRNDLKTYIKYLVFGSIWPEKFRESKLFKYLRNPTLRIHYDIELDYILKKSGLLMNSFGIQPVCPFVSRNIAEISVTLGSLNRNKNFYKQQLVTVLGESKMAFITKAGGATDVEYLFEGYDKCINALLDDPIFKPLINQKRRNQIRRQLSRHNELIIRLMYIYVFHRLFVSGEFDEKLNEPDIQIPLKDLLPEE